MIHKLTVDEARILDAIRDGGNPEESPIVHGLATRRILKIGRSAHGPAKLTITRYGRDVLASHHFGERMGGDAVFEFKKDGGA